MSKGSSKREQRETLLAQYELGGFAAGIVKNRLGRMRELLRLRAERFKGDAYLDRLIEEIETGLIEIERWQTVEQMRSAYPETYRRSDG